MLYRIKNKNYDSLIEINCSVKVMEQLINEWKEHSVGSGRLVQTPARFVEWINADTFYVALLQDNPVMFDF